jgi:hypothetical protein
MEGSKLHVDVADGQLGVRIENPKVQTEGRREERASSAR